MNSLVHNDRPPNRHRHEPDLLDDPDDQSVIGDLLSHVKQLNEEIHNRHTSQEAEEHYKSEWRMVALVLDRMLLIIFFIITILTSVIIFVNVPD